MRAAEARRPARSAEFAATAWRPGLARLLGDPAAVHRSEPATPGPMPIRARLLRHSTAASAASRSTSLSMSALSRPVATLRRLGW